MPLKGVLFQLLLYADPADRLLSDVDLLVPSEDFPAAIEALVAAGFEPEKIGRSLIEVALRSPRGLSVDLHRQLFSPGRYRLSTRAVFARASRDDRLLGVPLQIADPYDTAAHLIGKYVSDHVSSEAPARLAELGQWVEHSHLDPARLARHARACGMARAARHVFGQGAASDERVFFAAALAALPFDPLGHACARLAGVLMPSVDGTALAPLPAHLLNTSLLRAGASLALSTLNRWRHGQITKRSPAGDLPGAQR